MDAGRYFIHEHLKQATSWKDPAMRKMTRKENNIRAEVDQCQYELWFLTNSPAVAAKLQRKCPGTQSPIITAR